MAEQPIIWIVEDDVTVQRLICAKLSVAGFTPVVYESAERAYEALHKGQMPALLILDMLLPGMSGVDLVRLLKQNSAWSAIPVVVVSVLSRPDATVVGTDDSTVFWINKPFDANNLIQTVQRVLSAMGQKGGLIASDA